MKQLSKMFSIILLCGLIVSACASATPTPAPQQTVEPAAMQSPAPQAEATQAPAAQPQASPEPSSDVKHSAVPGNLPVSENAKKWGDQSTISSVNKARALGGDRFTVGKFERPYNSDKMDVYFPNLDIDRVVVYPDDPTWIYAVITMVGRDTNNAFTGQYGLELDLDLNGHEDILILVDNPAANDWSTQGVRVYQDTNGDVGGLKIIVADSAGASGNGFETVLFDQGKGQDPDLAWSRVDSSNPASFEIAFKRSLLADNKVYTAEAWAGTHLDPAVFDYNDHFTHEQAGAADSSITNFYPIKGLSEMDNTCRQAIGFDAKGTEPGICVPE
jgi:PBP1b-binding outer membrane lipoprotein LpoB